ncbi:hypothetical protein D3C81_2121120 [compost metagenome]
MPLATAASIVCAKVVGSWSDLIGTQRGEVCRMADHTFRIQGAAGSRPAFLAAWNLIQGRSKYSDDQN